jgi:hypothetical protein
VAVSRAIDEQTLRPWRSDQVRPRRPTELKEPVMTTTLQMLIPMLVAILAVAVPMVGIRVVERKQS